jgi:hypothetical protein
MMASERRRRWSCYLLCAAITAMGTLTTVLGWPARWDLQEYGDLAWTNPVCGMLIVALGLLLLVGSIRGRLRPTGDRMMYALFLVPVAGVGLLTVGGGLTPLLEPVVGLLLLWLAVFAVLLFTPQKHFGGTMSG